jgi:UDP-glucose 4-epimerase
MADTILVTGGAGYVGSHIVVDLARAGYAPVVLDNFSNSTPSVLPRLQALAGRPVPCVTADVRDVVALRAAFHDHPISAIIHCAGLKSVGESQARPLAYYDVNVGGAITLAEVMGEAGVATLVFSSSASVYGQPEDLPVTEDAPLRPHSVYGRTKRVVEDFLRDLARANANWRIAILRYFNPAGAHSSACWASVARPAEQPRAAVPDRRRRVPGTFDLRQRLAYSRWHRHSRLPARPGLGGGPRHCAEAPGGNARLRDLQPGCRAGPFGDGGDRRVRAHVRSQDRQVVCRPPARRRGQLLRGSDARASRVECEARLDAICADAWRWQKNGGRY